MLLQGGNQRVTVLLLIALLTGNSLSSATTGVAPSPGQNGANARNAILEANFRILGPAVVPLTSQKQNAIIVGVANVLGDGVLASDIKLTVTTTYNNISAAGRRLMQQQTEWPGADVVLNITTSADRADAEAHTLSTASNETYQLASDIGAQGLQTQEIILQSTDIHKLTQASSPSPPPPSPSPPPPHSPPPPGSPPPPQRLPPGSPAPHPAPMVVAPAPLMPATPAATPAATPSPSGTATGNSAGTSTKSGGSSFPIGAIIGIVAGVVVLAALLGLLMFMRNRGRKVNQQGEVIDYFSDLGKQGRRESGAGDGVPVTASSADPQASGSNDPLALNYTSSTIEALNRNGADSAPGSTKTTPRQLRIPRSATSTMNDKAEVPVDEKTEV